MKLLMYFNEKQSVGIVDPGNFLCSHLPFDLSQLTKEDWLSLRGKKLEGLCLCNNETYENTVLLQVVNDEQVESRVNFICRVISEKNLSIDTLVKLLPLDAFNSKQVVHNPLKASDVSGNENKYKHKIPVTQDVITSTPKRKFDQSATAIKISNSLNVCSKVVLNASSSTNLESISSVPQTTPLPTTLAGPSCQCNMISDWLKKINHRLSCIEEQLNNVKPNTGEAITDIRSQDWTLPLPVATTGDLETLEKILSEDNACYEFMVQTLSRCGGTGYRNGIKNIMVSLLTDDLASNYNMDGRRYKNFTKNPFMKHKTVIKAICESMRNGFKESESEIKVQIGNWLKQAPRRLQRHNPSIKSSNSPSSSHDLS
ncbi:uncharacterized protein LOC101240190 isoform X1 [Hydra vulgaris]|uniref:uncharacterized protein LOC101240190 isoform X1 n=1 Tax=Hydra vulgaris TaxID=6087 RepID=UPI0032EA2A3B